MIPKYWFTGFVSVGIIGREVCPTDYIAHRENARYAKVKHKRLSQNRLCFFYFNGQVECINGYRLKNGFHIDIFIPSKKVGIEYDGPKHQTPKQKARDKRKNLLLKEMGIKLYRVIESEEFCVEGNAIYVTYDKNYSYLNYAIENLCKLIGVPYVPLDVEGNKTAIIESYLTREKENSIASLYVMIKK